MDETYRSIDRCARSCGIITLRDHNSGPRNDGHRHNDCFSRNDQAADHDNYDRGTNYDSRAHNNRSGAGLYYRHRLSDWMVLRQRGLRAANVIDLSQGSGRKLTTR